MATALSYNLRVLPSQPTTRSGSGPSDAALVVAARANESWAKEALFRRYVHLVNGLAFRVIGRDADLDDLVQDSFIEAWRSLHRLENPQVFSSWLSAIVVRTAHKMLRRRRLMTAIGLRQREPIDLDNLVSGNAPQDVQVELRAIYSLVETLSPSTRLALLLRRVEGLSLEEVASMLGVSLATAKRRIADAERQLESMTAFESGTKGGGRSPAHQPKRASEGS
ncbi:MAG TPA: sigma-70 family RNA polymerase sigma factor [Polyangiaceae bacterium]|nr:sigma-70 family RNA polymerase sigma factor [Polyangiaceae bacterium]